ncbi:MAG: hypothetical protein ABI693_16555 [Bryobacteraceae bacterium]
MINHSSVDQAQIASLRQEIRDELPNGDAWLTTPHALLGGQSPEERLAEGDYEVVRNLVQSILYIGIS